MTRLTTNKCIEAWTNCIEQLNVKADIVFLGDSLTYYGRFAEIFPDYKVVNLGLRGDSLKGVIDRLGQIKALHPSFLFLMIGLNDIGVSSLDSFYRQYLDLVEKIKSFLPNIVIFLQSILPVNSAEFNISCDNQQVANYNSVIRQIAKEKEISYIDLFELYLSDDKLPSDYTCDGIHLMSNAYSLWYDALKHISITE